MKLKFWNNKEALTPQQRRQRKNDRLLLISSGILLGISFPPFPFPFQLFMFAALVPYFYVIDRREKLIDINRATYLTAFVFCLITIYWVGSWQAATDPFLLISGVLLVFFNPVFFLIPSTLFFFARSLFNKKWALFFFPLFWITYEYAYMITDASFPWLTLGSGLSHFLPFIQVAEFIGAVGISLLVLYINYFVFRAAFQSGGKRKMIFWTIALSLITLPIIYGYYRINTFEMSNKKVKVGIVQPNFDPWDKWSEESSPAAVLDLYFEMSKKAIDKNAALIVWPETAVPVYLMGGTYLNLTERIYSFLKEQNVYLLTGMPDLRFFSSKENAPSDVKYSKEGDYYYATYNAILLFSPNSQSLQRYGKMKLVPFGERVPFVDELPFLGNWIKWGVGISGWNVGQDTSIFFIPKIKIEEPNGIKEDSLRINGLVCYESIYPFFNASFVNKGVDFISVVTNDSWYGNSSGPYQHKEFAVLRAIENRKSVIRAANGGISCIIDPLGRTVKETKMFTRDVLTGDVILQPGKTFFTEHSTAIPLIASAFSLWILGLVIIRWIKKKLKI
ncbi:MAG: apolipoprotein N-acyltransferase [Ignavibacteria bacterium CG_4_9_14_3_um_filter_36_18]|nr:MAG: apolipoprotein N-acyltransferase [Ignavibacteria bacterium CG_4_9_14_3_um_filter_36_18]